MIRCVKSCAFLLSSWEKIVRFPANIAQRHSSGFAEKATASRPAGREKSKNPEETVESGANKIAPQPENRRSCQDHRKRRNPRQGKTAETNQMENREFADQQRFQNNKGLSISA
jgi:hypothetical protein